MPNNTVHYELTINNREAKTGAKKVIVRKSRHLEITIPAGVKTGTLVKLSGGSWVYRRCKSGRTA